MRSAGAAAATRHLLELGHRNVFHIAGPADVPAPRSCLAGWRDTLRAAGADIPGAMMGSGSPDGGWGSGRRAGRATKSRRSSWPVIRWHWESCARCSKPVGAFRRR